MKINLKKSEKNAKKSKEIVFSLLVPPLSPPLVRSPTPPSLQPLYRSTQKVVEKRKGDRKRQGKRKGTENEPEA